MTRYRKIAAVVLPLSIAAIAVVLRSAGNEGITIFGADSGRSAGERTGPSAETSEPVVSGETAAVPAGVPVGSIVAWARDMTNTPALPGNWAECDGRKIDMTESPYDGMAVPDLNGTDGAPPRFLRGAVRSGNSGGSERHQHGRVLLSRSGNRTVNVSGWTTVDHLPPYHEIVWIIKIAEDRVSQRRNGKP